MSLPLVKPENPLEGIDLLICDFDNSCYHSTKEYADAVNLLYADFLVEKGLSEGEEASRALAKKYYKDYGHGIFGPQENGHDICPEEYFSYIHTEVLKRKYMEAHLVGARFDLQALLPLNIKFAMFTQGSRPYALHGIKFFGYEDIFPEKQVYGFDCMGLSQERMKHNAYPWQKVADDMGVPYHRVAVLEDSCDYLKPPKALGMRTIFVENDQYFHFNFKEVGGDHVHYHYKSTTDFINAVVAGMKK